MQSFSLSLARSAFITEHRDRLPISAPTAKDSSLNKGHSLRGFVLRTNRSTSLFSSNSFHVSPSHSVQQPPSYNNHTHPAAGCGCPAKARHHGNCSFPSSNRFIVREAVPVHTVPPSTLPAQTNTAQTDVNSHSKTAGVGGLHT